MDCDNIDQLASSMMEETLDAKKQEVIISIPNKKPTVLCYCSLKRKVILNNRV